MRKLKLSLLITILILSIVLGGWCLVFFVRLEEDSKVITTNYAVYDICNRLLGSEDDVLLLGKGVDMHGFQPSVRDIVNISNCDMFVYIGGESDSWVDGVLENNNNEDRIALKLIDYVETVCNEDHDHGHDNHHHEHSEDEHIWLSIKNMISITNEVYSSLITVYPDKASIILENKNKLISDLTILDEEYSLTFSNFNGTVIIADRFPFTYLFKDYDIKYYSLFTGCSAETNASLDKIETFVNTINTLDVNYVFTLENSDPLIAKQIINNSDCKEGVELLTLNSIQTVDRDKIGEKSYIEIMRNNLQALKKVVL